MTTGPSATCANFGGAAGVLLRGPGWQVELTAAEARELAAEVGATHPAAAASLRDAADAVDRFTGFDGPLGEPCEEIESRPSHLETARAAFARR